MLPLVLFYKISEYLDIITIYHLEKIFSINLLDNYCNKIFKNHILHYMKLIGFTNPEKITEIIKETNSMMSGSFVLQVMLHEHWPSDINIYTLIHKSYENDIINNSNNIFTKKYEKYQDEHHYKNDYKIFNYKKTQIFAVKQKLIFDKYYKHNNTEYFR